MAAAYHALRREPRQAIDRLRKGARPVAVSRRGSNRCMRTEPRSLADGDAVRYVAAIASGQHTSGRAPASRNQRSRYRCETELGRKRGGLRYGSAQHARAIVRGVHGPVDIVRVCSGHDDGLPPRDSVDRACLWMERGLSRASSSSRYSISSARSSGGSAARNAPAAAPPRRQIAPSTGSNSASACTRSTLAAMISTTRPLDVTRTCMRHP
jgi:hypothetical protein